jgi:hypothetical protein
MFDPDSQQAKEIRRIQEDRAFGRNHPPSPPPEGCCLGTIFKGMMALVLLAGISFMASQANNHKSPPQPAPPEQFEFFDRENSK